LKQRSGGALIGRRDELARLREAILARQSLLVHGRSGAGKTALLTETLSGLPEHMRRKCLMCTGVENPRTLWRSLALSLAKAGDGQVMSRWERECAGTRCMDRWICEQTSLRLRGILRRALQESAYWVILDALARVPDGACPLLEEWIWSRRTPVILAGRGSTEQELGRAARLFWHRGMRMELLPLGDADRKALLEQAIHRFGLAEVADEDFRRFVLKSSQGLPGRIIRLCELACQNAYQWHGRIKLHTLAVDFLRQADSCPRSLRLAS